MIDLAALEQLAAQATPGPWRWGTGIDPDWPSTYLVTVDKRERWNFGPEPREHEAIVLDDDSPMETHPENASFIAACSPDVVTALVRVAYAAAALDLAANAAAGDIPLFDRRLDELVEAVEPFRGQKP